MKKALLSLLMAFVALPMFGQTIMHEDTIMCTPLTWRDSVTYSTDTTVMYVTTDTIFVLTYTRHSAYDNTNDTVAVNGTCTATWNNKVWRTPGVFVDTLKTVGGCDSLVSINVSLSKTGVEDSVTVTAGCFYLWGTDTIRDFNVHDKTFTAANGCDSIVHLSVSAFSGLMTDSVEIVACDTFFTKNYLASWIDTVVATGTVSHTANYGTYPVTATTTAACSRTSVLDVTIVTSNRDSSSITPVSITDAGCFYLWGGDTITDSNIHYHIFTTAVGGCDSIAAIQVANFTGIQHDTTFAKICGKNYKWVNSAFVGLPNYNNGFTFTTDTVTNITLSDTATGCTSVYTLDLKFYTKHDTIERKACDVYRTDDENSTFTYRILNANGTYTLGPATSFDSTGYYEVNHQGDSMYTVSNNCATRKTLHITIKNSEKRYRSTDTLHIDTCDFYRFRLNASNKTINYTCDTAVVSPETGYESCFDSILLLSVKIRKSTSRDLPVHACDSYTWDETGETYSYNVTKSVKVPGGNVAGCDSNLTLKLTVDKTPEITISGNWVLMPGGNTVLHAESNLPISTYKWYINNSSTVSSTADSISLNNVTSNTDVRLDVVSTKNCPATSWITVTATLGIDDINALQANLYPNPTSRFLNIESPETISLVEVFNTVGQQVILRQANSNSLQLDLGSLATGSYTLRILGENGQQTTRRFIVNK